MAGKKVKGRKRHIIVDTMGSLLAVHVHKANLNDNTSGIIVAMQAYSAYPGIERFCADAGHCGAFIEEVRSCLQHFLID